MSRMDSHITKTLGDFANRSAEMEQNFSTFAARLCKVETYATSASNVSGSARSWPALAASTGSHGPGSSDDHRNTRRRLDTSSSTGDEKSRSAVYYDSLANKGITKWIDTLWEEANMQACNKPVRIPCKAGSVSVRLVFETRGLQAIQVLAPRFRLFGTFLPDKTFTLVAPDLSVLGVSPEVLQSRKASRVIRLPAFSPPGGSKGSAICIHRGLLSEDAIVTHEVTSQGHDHLVSIRSWQHSLVIVNVHTSLRLPNLITPGEMPRPWVTYALCQGFIVFLSIFLWLRRVISTAHLMLLRISG